MSKILGLDLGTNSIGWSLRNTQLSENQMEKFGVITFNKGVGNSKTGEYSYAAERTQKRSTRRLYQSRKYRLWNTLNVLISEGYCPLSQDALDKWRKYSKEEAQKNNNAGRVYPKDEALFEQWIKLDFDRDGKPDYKSPYQMRRALVEEKFDFTKETDRYKLGRALYHIAQRRGFKSSRKGSDDIKENTEDVDIDLQYSEKKKSKPLIEQFAKYPLAKTIGALFSYLEDDGIRIRENMAQHAIRENYKDEIKDIFKFQELGLEHPLYIKTCVAFQDGKKKNCIGGTIFYKRPLRSQKGLIGLCTLEQETRIDPKTNKPFQVGKYRAPVSHPSFELFRAWQVLNNIKYKEASEPGRPNKSLDLALKQDLLTHKFLKSKKGHFNFSELAGYISKKKSKKLIFNYKPKQNITGCPVSARLKDIFGDDWLNVKIEKQPSLKQKKNYYDIYDIWHILFSYEDQEFISDFATEKLKLDDDNIKKFVYAWNAVPVGYGMLSINAIEKINRFLFKGLQYTESVLLANLPHLVGEAIWEENEALFVDNIEGIINENRSQKHIIQTVNNLIAKYKNLDQKFGYKDDSYVLDESDIQDITDAIIEHFGESVWLAKTKEEADEIFMSVKDCYQSMFTFFGRKKTITINRREFKKENSDFYLQPKLKDSLAEYASKVLNVDISKLKKIYHHSDISTYPPAMPDENGDVKMGSPKTGSFKNPMAMRTLQELKKLLNYLIETNQIDAETRVVVEIARQLNDSNMRWAIETKQRQREAENKEFAEAIKQLLSENKNINASMENDDDIDKLRLFYELNAEQNLPPVISEEEDEEGVKISSKKKKAALAKEHAQRWDGLGKKLIDKYRLWKEQGYQCIYTGKYITITDLFTEGVIDFEHTLPRSKSFDNSLANQTVCFADYNRTVKKNSFPSQLPNYDKDTPEYTAILPRLSAWEEKVERIKQQIDFWQTKSTKAANKIWKDDAIRQKHLWKMELEYWSSKIERFKIKEITSGFKNSQLVDTQLISKYAFHYLKTYFDRVDVQKGEVTSIFRKIYALQPQNFDEKKDRSKHSHHAKDATILTLIPQAAKREEILKEYYETVEQRKRFQTLKPYPAFNISSIFEIDDNVLINSLNNIQFLSKAKKLVRKRGKVQLIEGTELPKYATGDSIRGQLHQETFYGAIKPAKLDDNGRMQKDEQGNFIQEDDLKFVLRVPFTSDFNSVEKIVDEQLKKQIQKHIIRAGSFKNAFEEGIYLLDKKGNPHGNKIRHIRVWSSVADPLQIKKQTYLSPKEYKQHYYAANATNSYFALYQDNEKTKKEFAFRNLLEVAQSLKVENIHSEKDLFEPFIMLKKGKSTLQLDLKYIMKPGARVLFLKEGESINDLKEADYFKRLYVYTSFEKDARLNFKFYLEARNKIEEPYKDSEIDFDNPKPTLRFGYAKYNFGVEAYDFEIMMDGTIMLK